MVDKIKDERIAKLTPPEWLSRDALRLWNKKLAEVARLKSDEVLDALDEELLAMYCDSVITYRKIADKKPQPLSTENVKDLQAWSRIIRDCGDKLGFTPRARARLKKKK
jgi:phage terminase small subunit